MLKHYRGIFMSNIIIFDEYKTNSTGVRYFIPKDMAAYKRKQPCKGFGVVKYGEGMVEQLVSVFEILRTGAVIAVVALILVTAFLIANTIKITIMSRKREIEIMRLVGASNINVTGAISFSERYTDFVY